MLRIVLISILLLASLNVKADILVVANPDLELQQIELNELADIFLKRHASLAAGVRAVPVNRPAGSDIRSQFEARVIDGMNARELKNYWLKMRYKGVRPPVIQDSEAAVILFVKRVSGAIAYLNQDDVPEGVKLLARIEN